MSLLQWQNNGWLRPHVTDKNEIANLLAIADRDMEDASSDGISDDWKFGIAYNAALKLATIMLYAAGFNGIVLPPRNWTNADNVVIKSS